MCVCARARTNAHVHVNFTWIAPFLSPFHSDQLTFITYIRFYYNLPDRHGSTLQNLPLFGERGGGGGGGGGGGENNDL